MKLRRDLAALLPRLRDDDVPRFCTLYERYAAHLGAIGAGLYDRLGAEDQARFLVWFLKRWGKIDLINGVERGLYDATLERTRAEPRPQVELAGTRYWLRDLKPQGFDFQLLGYDWFLGVHDILYAQYENALVQLQPDDVIIDAGAFIGDTAVFFHHKLGGRCRIHSFELLDENLSLLLHNLERNGVPEEHIVVNKLALADRTGGEIVVSAGGSQGAASIFGNGGPGDRIPTVTIDDYVVGMQLPRVDFIKMDIEGAEVMALKGARQTIAHFKPRLAICLYHKWDDVFTVPAAIAATGVAYTYSFKWVQLRDGWEAVLLAAPCSPDAAAAPTPVPVADGADAALADALAVLTKACGRSSSQAEALRRETRLAAVPSPA